MFRRKKCELYVVTLTPAEKRLMIYAMMRFRNKLIALNKPTEDADELLLRLLQQYLTGIYEELQRVSSMENLSGNTLDRLQVLLNIFSQL